MSARIDHVILPVNNLQTSLTFYCEVLGFSEEGQTGPFTIVRVARDFILLLAQFENKGGMHLAFSFDQQRFDSVMHQTAKHGLSYGDRFNDAANGLGPVPQRGATGDELSLYLEDPSRHLIEVRISSI